jgi:peptide/nickel transport system permease protein
VSVPSAREAALGRETARELAAELAPERGPLRTLLDHPRVLVALALLALLGLSAILSPWVSPHDPLAVDPTTALLPPGPGHWLGTDELGRDVLSRALWGGRVSLPVALITVTASLVGGGLVGMVAGYRGGVTDLVLMRFIDALLAFPALVLAIALVAALGPGIGNAMIAIGIVQVPVYARLTRAQVLQIRTLEFVTAARALGSSTIRIAVRHMLVNMLNPLIVQASLSAAFAILTEATLSFLGLGAQPPTPDWGFMLNNGAHYLPNGDWWLTVGPGGAICLAVFAYNWLGDALRDALDPRLKQG